MFQVSTKYRLGVPAILPYPEESVLHRMLELVCDSCEQPFNCRVVVEDAEAHERLRRYAASLGWRSHVAEDGQQDICADCDKGITQRRPPELISNLRSVTDIIKAHTLIEMLRRNRLPMVGTLPEDCRERVEGNAMVLCWMVHGSSGFGEFLHKLESSLNAQGIVIDINAIQQATGEAAPANSKGH